MTNFNHRHHADLLDRAAYFSWSARRGFPGPGCDPMTGLNKSIHDETWCAAGRASNIAQARVFFALARNFRLTH